MIRAAIIAVTTARPATHPLEVIVKRNSTQKIAQKYEASMVAIIPQKTAFIPFAHVIDSMLFAGQPLVTH